MYIPEDGLKAARTFSCPIHSIDTQPGAKHTPVQPTAHFTSLLGNIPQHASGELESLEEALLVESP